MEDVFPASPAPVDENHPLGSSDEEHHWDEERARATTAVTNDEPATLDVDDDLDGGEENRPFQIPTGYVLVKSAPAALTAVLVSRPIMLLLDIDCFMGTITRQAQARTRHLYEFRSTATIAHRA